MLAVDTSGMALTYDSASVHSSPPRKRGSRVAGVVLAALDARFRGHDDGEQVLESIHWGKVSLALNPPSYRHPRA